jgi:hypothetical protein
MLALLIWRNVTSILGADRMSGHRTIDVIRAGDQRLGQEDVMPRPIMSTAIRSPGRASAAVPLAALVSRRPDCSKSC